jgi:hypothetical protein
MSMISGFIGRACAVLATMALAAAALATPMTASLGGNVVLPSGVTLTASALLLQRLAANGQYWENLGYTAQLTGNGDYRYPALPAGTYRVCYEDNVLLRYCFDGHDEGAFAGFAFTPIALADGQQRHDIHLEPQPGSSISGRVRDTYDPTTVFSGISVTIHDENGVAFEDRHDIATGADGSWTVGGIAPGSYYVRVQSTNFVSQFHPGDECVDDCWPEFHGELLTVPADGAVQNLDFALAPYSVVRVRVTDSRGDPIAQPRVGGWAHLMGPALLYPARYDAVNGDYVLYMEADGEAVGAAATGYVWRLVVTGNCYDLIDCWDAYSPLVLGRGEVRQVTLRLTSSDSYLFANDFD